MQVDSHPGQDERVALPVSLNDVLRILAQPADFAGRAQPLLDLARRATEAGAAWFIVFGDSTLDFRSGAVRRTTIDAVEIERLANATDAAYLRNPPALKRLTKRYPTVLLLPIRVDGQAVAALLLVDSILWEPSAHKFTIEAVVNGFTALVNEARRERLRDQAGRFDSAALASLLDPVITLDVERRIVSMNPAAEAALGINGEEVAGQPWTDVSILASLAADLERDTPPEEWSRDGLEQVFSPHVQPLRDDLGVPFGFALVLHNRTQFKKLSRNHTEFMRLVSHDLRTPLTYMKGFANMLEVNLEGNVPLLYSVNKVMNGINQIDGIINNIQDAGRYDPETGFYELNRVRCDVREMVRRIVENHLVPVEKKLTLSLDLDRHVPIVNADANMLERAITNLVDNAIKYTPIGGEITVGCHVANSSLVVSVHDTGLGISSENQKKLFQRHFRIKRPEHQKIKGTGLGLFIVRSVAQRHSGQAWVESDEGEGSTFFLSIPLSGDNLFSGQLELPFEDL